MIASTVPGSVREDHVRTGPDGTPRVVTLIYLVDVHGLHVVIRFPPHEPGVDGPAEARRFATRDEAREAWRQLREELAESGYTHQGREKEG